MPLGRAYRPELVLVSAGFDAHRDDPLGSCACTDEGFAAMTASVRRLAEELDVPAGLVLEGGYDLAALATSLVASLEVLGADGGPGRRPGAGGAPARDGRGGAARRALAGVRLLAARSPAQGVVVVAVAPGVVAVAPGVVAVAPGVVAVAPGVVAVAPGVVAGAVVAVRRRVARSSWAPGWRPARSRPSA